MILTSFVSLKVNVHCVNAQQGLDRLCPLNDAKCYRLESWKNVVLHIRVLLIIEGEEIINNRCIDK